MKIYQVTFWKQVNSSVPRGLLAVLTGRIFSLGIRFLLIKTQMHFAIWCCNMGLDAFTYAVFTCEKIAIRNGCTNRFIMNNHCFDSL